MVDSSHFETRLPPQSKLLPGRYRVYGDIVHESGFAQTLVSEVDVPATTSATGYAMLDTDDSWSAGPVAEAADDAEVRRTLPDGCELVWERGKGPLVERREHPLRFRVVAPDGKPAALEPYMGMIAHAMVTRADGTVFAHLHPTGSTSMAAQMALIMRTPADTLAGTLGKRIAAMDAQAGAMHGMAGMSGMGGMGNMSGKSGSSDTQGAFAIPYGFPKAGRYRMWVQVKRGGKIETAAFDVDVAAAGVMAAR